MRKGSDVFNPCCAFSPRYNPSPTCFKHVAAVAAAALGGFGGATPHGKERAGDDDFVLHSSQTYERGLSQLTCDLGQDGSDMQDALTQTQFQLEPTLPRGGLEQLQDRLPQPQAAQPSMSSAGQGQVEQPVPRRTSDASTCSNRATPCAYIQEEEASCSGVPKLFPVFRRREDYKVCSRHHAADSLTAYQQSPEDCHAERGEPCLPSALHSPAACSW